MKPEQSYCLIFTTCANREQAEALARSLLEQKLAACINIQHGIESMYHWQGELQQEQESMLLIKTSVSLRPEVQQLLQSVHPYELPEIISVPIDSGSTPYLDWIQSQLKTP